MSAHLDSTFGAIFIAMVVAATLHGVSCVQALYFFTNQNDSWYIKLPVIAVMTLDTLHQALISHTVYTYAITDWGNPAQLQLIVWSLPLQVVFNGVTALIVQGFLTLRIWRLSNRNIYITSISAMLVLGALVSVIIFVAKAFKIETFAGAILINLKRDDIFLNVAGAAADLFIAATLCTLLNFSRTGFRRSDAIINRLIIFSVNTGLLTSFCALGSLISILASPDTFICIAFYICLGRLYTNSLLATLNARNILFRGTCSEARSTDNTSVILQDIPKGSQQQNLSIKIDTTREYHSGDQKRRDGSIRILDGVV